MSRLVGYYIKQMPEILEKADLGSDVYFNCLAIKHCLEDLDRAGLLTVFEKAVVNQYYAGNTTAAVAFNLNVSRVTAEIAFNRVTSRVAFILGSEFTDQAHVYKRTDV